MIKPFERPDHDQALLQYSRMARLVRAAEAVCVGRTTVDTNTFPVIPLDDENATWETGGILAEQQDIYYAFTTAFYAPGYGPAAAETTFTPGETVEWSLGTWADRVTTRFNAAASPEAFADLFFRGGFWRVVLDPAVSEFDTMRSLLERPDFGGLGKTSWMLGGVEQIRQGHMVRDNLPHIGSHRDIARFANMVLHLGESELGIVTPAELASLLERSLPSGEDIAFLGIQECNAAFAQMARLRSLAQRKYFVVDHTAQKVSLNYARILRDIDLEVADAARCARRGCPALFLRTPYEGKKQPLFRALNKTLVRMYCQTGALTDPRLRRLGLSI